MIQLPKRIAENIDRFTGRTWLLPKIQAWLDKSDERFFLLTGGPGTGKSMSLAWLAGFGRMPVTADAQQQLVELRARVKAAHFCVADSGNTDPKEVARQIADHLTRTVPGFGKALAATLAEQVRIDSVIKDVTVEEGGIATGVYIGRLNLEGLSEELSFNRVLRDPLKQLYEDGYKEQMVLLFDALDEALTYSGATNVVQLLAKLSDLPSQVRILATTRDEPRVLTFFHDVRPFNLVKDAAPKANDVFTYAKGQLAKLKAIDKVTREGFAQRLSTQSAGIFLYAALVLDEIRIRLPSQLPNFDTYPLPNGLSGLYHSFLIRELGTEDRGRRWHRVYKPLLGLIAVAQGDGLTAGQLTTLIGEDVAEPLDACKQYLSGDLPDGPFRPFHKSFADFLFEDKQNVRYHIDPSIMHGRIAKYYWSKYHKDWSQCPSYGLEHLAIHLVKSWQDDRLEQLISPEWMQARVKYAEYRYSGFVADLMLAWHCAREKALRQIEENNAEFVAFATCFRYALIRTSINSLSNNYSATLVTSALETKVWSIKRALNVCADVADAERRAEMYLAVLQIDKVWPAVLRQSIERDVLLTAERIRDADRAWVLVGLTSRLGGAQKRTALDAVLVVAQTINDARARAEAMTGVASQLSGAQKQKVLDAALEAAQKIKDADDRVKALTQVASQLSGAQKQKVLEAALEAAQKINYAGARGGALTRLALQLSGAQKQKVLDAALAAAQKIEVAYNLSFLWEQLVPQLKGKQVARALMAAQKIKDADHRAEVLTQVAWKLSGVQNRRGLNMALEAASKIKDADDRVKALTQVASQLSGAQNRTVLDLALAVAQTISAPPDRAMALTRVASQLRGAQKRKVLDEALAVAHAIINSICRVGVLGEMVRELKDAQKGTVSDEALAVAQTINDARARAEALTEVASQLSGAQKQKVLDAALAAAQTIRRTRWKSEALKQILWQLSGEQKRTVLGVALEVAQEIGDVESRAETLTEMAWKLSGAQKQKVLDAALAMVETIDFGDTYNHSFVWDKLFPQLRGEQLARALLMVQKIEDNGDRAEVRMYLALQLSGGQKQKVLDEVLAFAPTFTRAIEWGILIPQLKGEQVTKALLVAQKIEDNRLRAEVLMYLALQLSGAQKQKVLDAALAVAQKIEGADGRANALTRLALRLSGAQKQKVLDAALAVAQTINDARARAEAMTGVASQLSGAQKQKVLDAALEAAQKIKSTLTLTFVFEELVPQLKGKQVARALMAAQKIKDANHRVKALTQVASQLSGAQKRRALNAALEAAQKINDARARAEALTRMASQLSGAQKSKVLEEVLAAAQKIKHTRIQGRLLKGLVPQLSDMQVEAMLTVAKSALDPQTCLMVLGSKTMFGRTRLLPQIRHCLLESVERMLDCGTRMEILNSLVESNVGQSSVIGDETGAAIAQDIVEIGERWRWV